MIHFVSANTALLRHLTCGKLQSSDAFLHVARNLDSFVLLIGNRGKLFIRQDDAEYVLEEGRFLLLLPGHDHSGYRPSPGPLSYYWCHFQVREPYTLLDEAAVSRYLRTTKPDGGSARADAYVLPVFGEIDAGDRISLLFHQLLDLAARSACPPRMTDCALSLLAMEITQSFVEGAQGTAKPASKIQRHMVEIMDWIRVHYNMPLTVQCVAEQFSYNPDYLSTMFRRMTGLPLWKYIHKTRVAMAKQLLLSSSLSVKQIAADVGFPDEKNFMKVFRRLEDVTPTQYRRAYFHTHLNKD